MNKPILALETCDKNCSICLYYNDEAFFQYDVMLKYSHSNVIISLIEKVLNEAKIQLNDLLGIAISEGPGSFTGLRIGFSIAKSLALAHNLKIASISTFDSTALEISNYLPNETVFNIISKVNSDEVYLAKYQTQNGTYLILKEVEVVLNNEIENRVKDELVYSSNLIKDNYRKIFYKAFNIAKLSSLSIEKFSDEYDYLEPNYLKKFIIKGKTNV